MITTYLDLEKSTAILNHMNCPMLPFRNTSKAKYIIKNQAVNSKCYRTVLHCQLHSLQLILHNVTAIKAL